MKNFNKPMTIFFHGPSGCGKDTQVSSSSKYDFENIGTGEMIRKMYDKKMKML